MIWGLFIAIIIMIVLFVVIIIILCIRRKTSPLHYQNFTKITSTPSHSHSIPFLTPSTSSSSPSQVPQLLSREYYTFHPYRNNCYRNGRGDRAANSHENQISNEEKIRFWNRDKRNGFMKYICRFLSFLSLFWVDMDLIGFSFFHLIWRC